MTDNQASVIDEAAFSVRRTISIAAPLDKVWRAVTEPEHISRWFGRVVLEDAGAGATGTITFPEVGAVPLKVEAVDAPRMVAYRWGNDAAGPSSDGTAGASTVFTFTLEEVPGGTRLTVVETGFDRTSDPAGNMADHAEGWVSELDKLVALLEGSEAGA